jgi:hypothetical protein
VRVLLLTGLLAGTLDITAACIHAYLANGTSPLRVLQFITSAAMGPEAFAGGWNTALWGLIIHLVIAGWWTFLYFLFRRRIRMLIRSWIVAGFGYGLFVWIVMNLAVLPMTTLPHGPFKLYPAVVGVSILVAMIGLPIAYAAQRFDLGRA